MVAATSNQANCKSLTVSGPGNGAGPGFLPDGSPMMDIHRLPANMVATPTPKWKIWLIVPIVRGISEVIWLPQTLWRSINELHAGRHAGRKPK